MILNPVAQIQKGQDATRQHDLKQIATGLDSYFNDNNSYPKSDLSVLVSAKDIHAIPNDPAANAKSNYAYVYDGEVTNPTNATPQWNVLFAKLAFPSTSDSTLACPLEKMRDSGSNVCVPKNYVSSGYNYCIISGNVNCDQITDMTVVPLPISLPPGEVKPISPPAQFYCWCSTAEYWLDPLHGCLVMSPARSDTNLYLNRYCTSNSGTCAEPCTPD